MYVICFTDKSLFNKYETTSENPEEWKKKHKDVNVRFVFDTESSVEDTRERENFESKCGDYGFCPDNYNDEFRIGEDIFLFVGFDNKNKIFPCCLKNKETGQYRQVSVDLIMAKKEYGTCL